jgi:hypothetical protein
MDDWHVRPNLTFEIGVRQDWEIKQKFPLDDMTFDGKLQL